MILVLYNYRYVSITLLMQIIPPKMINIIHLFRCEHTILTVSCLFKILLH